LDLYARSDDSLITSLGLLNKSVDIPDTLREIIRLKTIPAVKDPGNDPLFSTFWTIIDTMTNSIVGDHCFKGNPNA
jgi:hypothetical protein